MPASKLYQIDYLNEFDFLGDEYVALFRSSRATVFQAPFWLKHMYDQLIPALGVKPIIVTLRDKQTNELKLVLPLVKTSYAGMSCIEPADLGICDYNAVIASDHLDEAFFKDDDLQKQIIAGLRPVHLIFFRKMNTECEVVSHVFGDVKVGEMENCSYDVPLSAPFDGWRQQNMSSSFRKELRRKRRKLEEFGEVTFTILEEEDEIRQAMALMREQRRVRYEADLFMQDAYFDFYCTIAVEGAKNGFAQTAILEAGSDVVAVEFGLTDAKCYSFILAGMDSSRYFKASPGIIMIDHILEHRVEQGDTRADFTIGDEPYKARYNTTPTQLKHLSRSESVMGSLALKAYTTTGPVKEIAKKIANMGRG